ncbi:MAG: hypothetical protein DRH43_05095 [Deltaproteobacteria bacterium]|nr:MAG: hypothetical protein DRH43_05095 [Deltaproteobacteria bacterium]
MGNKQKEWIEVLLHQKSNIFPAPGRHPEPCANILSNISPCIFMAQKSDLSSLIDTACFGFAKIVQESYPFQKNPVVFLAEIIADSYSRLRPNLPGVAQDCLYFFICLHRVLKNVKSVLSILDTSTAGFKLRNNSAQNACFSHLLDIREGAIHLHYL